MSGPSSSGYSKGMHEPCGSIARPAFFRTVHADSLWANIRFQRYDFARAFEMTHSQMPQASSQSMSSRLRCRERPSAGRPIVRSRGGVDRRG